MHISGNMYLKYHEVNSLLESTKKAGTGQNCIGKNCTIGQICTKKILHESKTEQIKIIYIEIKKKTK